MTRSVAIVQWLVADYRAPFFLGLAERLAAEGVQLTVFADRSPPGEGFADGLDSLPFARLAPRRMVGRKAYWQAAFAEVRGFDLAIVEQANAALLNYPLILSRRLLGRPRRVAFWGHGATFQRNETDPLRDWLKARLASAVDHWFAYTEASRERLARTAVDPSRITVVNNSVDTSEIAAVRLGLDAAARAAARREIGLSEAPVCVFCSRLYPGKRLEFLIEAMDRLNAVTGAQLVVIGRGPQEDLVRLAAQSRPWLRYVGPLYGEAKARVLALGDVLVMPALVGLSILDGFAAGLPCAAAAFENHSPEIAYLEDGDNGLFTPAEAGAYADALAGLLGDPERLATMKRRAVESAERYSLQAMIDRFAEGVLSALPPSRPPRPAPT